MQTLIARVVSSLLAIILLVLGVYAISVGQQLDPAIYTLKETVYAVGTGMFLIAMGLVLLVAATMLEG